MNNINKSTKEISEYDIKKLVDEIDTIGIENITNEQLIKISEQANKLRKEYNPYSSRNMVPDDEYLLTLFTPMYRDYLVKLVFTAIIAFLNRARDEWGVPDNVPVVSVYDYIKNPTLLDVPKPEGPHGELDPDLKQNYEDNQKFMEKRLIVGEFLEHLFQYNPDEHVRSSYSPNPQDEKRHPVITPAGKLSAWMEKKRLETAKRKNRALIDKAKNGVEFLENVTINKEQEDNKTYVKEVTQRIGSRTGGFKIVKRKIKCTKSEYDAYQKSKQEKLLPREEKILPKLNDPVFQTNKKEEFIKYQKLLDSMTHDVVREMIPPGDTQHKFFNYFDSNYEKLGEAVYDLYGVKPDLEYAIHPLGMFKDMATIREFRRKMDGRINWPMYVVQKGVWSILSPFTENRDKLDFQGSNMPLFEEMFQKMEREKEIGAEMMKRRKTKKVKEQEKKVGKVSPEIRTHAAAVTDVSQFVSEVEDPSIDYTPEDDAVMVRVNRISAGGRTIQTTSFETDYDVEATMQQLSVDPGKTD